MKELEEYIAQYGTVKEGNVLKVDAFLNHQCDVELFDRMGAEWARLFAGKQIDKILTIEASGIGIACVVSRHFGNVPVVFAKKYQSINLDGEQYCTSIHSFTKQKDFHVIVAKKFLHEGEHVLLIDDFGQLLHPDVLCHLVEIFESCNKQSQMLVVDCNPSLLRDGLLRKDAIWFAQKDNESSTVFYSLSDFKGRSRTSNYNRYLQGAFGALPVTSDFYFVHDGTPVDDVEEDNEKKEEN